MLEITVKRLHEDAQLPRFVHGTDAGADLCSVEDVVLEPGERALVSTGFAMALPESYAAFIQPRSGMAAKHGISVVNTPGTIDAGYRGEIKVILINHDLRESYTVAKGDRIAQMIIQKIEQPNFKEVAVLAEGERGENGFGSTGIAGTV